MGPKSYKIIGSVFDFLAAAVSLLDLFTDIVIIITWHNQNRTIFFWISFTILVLAQLSHVFVFYVNHGQWPSDNWDLIHTSISILFTLPFAPLLSFIFYLVADDDAILRKIINKIPIYNFSWHNVTVDKNASTMKQYLEKKLYKHVGFLTEAIVEGTHSVICSLTINMHFTIQNN